MNSIVDNAFFLLRVMLENGFVSNQYATKNQLQELSGLDEIAYNQAENYLLENRLMDRYGLGDKGARGINSTGIDYITQTMQSRIPLSLNAERIFRIIVDEADNQKHKRMYVNEAANISKLDIEVVKKAFQELYDEGLIECPVIDKKNGRELSVIQWGAVASSEGRNALRRNFYIPQAPTTQIAAIYNAPVTANNLVNAINSQIEQTFNQNDSAEILKALDDTLRSLADSITPHLGISERSAYLQTITELKAELEKPEPDRTVIQRLIGVVSFADNLNGTWDLAVKAAPFIPILYEGGKNLLRALGVGI